MNSGVVYEPLAVVAIPARASPSDATVSNTTGCTSCEATDARSPVVSGVTVEQHRVTEREEAILAGECLGVEAPPAFTDEGVDHHQQRGAREMEVRHQHVDHLPLVTAMDEDVGTAVQFTARCR